MHESLSKSPVTYFLAQVQFTNIESIEKYIPEIQDKIRSSFPGFNKSSITIIEVRDNKQLVPSSMNQWHFKDKDSLVGVLLDGKSATIHTSKYDRFDKIAKQFEEVLQEINNSLNISLCVRLGVRYINVIKSNLKEYLNPSLMGFHLQENKFFDLDKYLSNTELTQKSKNGIIRVKSSYIGHKETNPGGQNSLVPYDLINIANNLNFSHHDQPNDKFLILDIDHFDDSQREFEVRKIIDNLTALQDAAYAAFCSAVTPKALIDWK